MDISPSGEGEAEGLPSCLSANLEDDSVGEEERKAWAVWVGEYRKCLQADPMTEEERREKQRLSNPRYILRNHLCQEAIEAAEKGEFGAVNDLLDVIRRPFDDQPGKEGYTRVVPKEKEGPGVSVLSCSS